MGFWLKHNKLGHRNVKKVGPPGAMHVVHSFQYLRKVWSSIKGAYWKDNFEILLGITWDIAGIILRYALDKSYRSLRGLLSFYFVGIYKRYVCRLMAPVRDTDWVTDWPSGETVPWDAYAYKNLVTLYDAVLISQSTSDSTERLLIKFNPIS